MWVTHYLLLGLLGGTEAHVQPPAQQEGGIGPFVSPAVRGARLATEQRRRDAERRAQEQAAQAAQAAQEAAQQAQQAAERQTPPERVELPPSADVQRIAADAIAAARRVPGPATVAGRALIADAEAQALALAVSNRRRAEVLLALLEAWR